MKKNIWLSTICVFLQFPYNGFGQNVGEPLSTWDKGTLEIHHISTGRGSSTFFILPDKTTMLYDAGEFTSSSQAWRIPRFVEAKPDTTKAAGEWLENYISRQLSRVAVSKIDYALLSHFHRDHYGQVTEASPLSENGSYRLTGLTTIGDRIPIGTLLDRGWNTYDYPTILNRDTTFINYLRFVDWQRQNNGLTMLRFIPGSNSQIKLMNEVDSYPNFEVRNIAANGEVWTGESDNTKSYFPRLEELEEDEYPTENMSSVVIKLSFGKFDYYTGGDLRGIPPPGFPEWHDMETPVAHVVGAVDVASLNHHGYVDSQNAFFVSTLQPRVWMLPVWDSAHPTHGVYKRILSEKLYNGPRDVFATSMHEANKLVVVGLDQLKSDNGHVVIKVFENGAKYMIYVIDNTDEAGIIKEIHGPYYSK